MIINNIASLVNNTLVSIFNQGIKFYQILIGMFIFDLIIYYICKFLKEAKKIRY